MKVVEVFPIKGFCLMVAIEDAPRDLQQNEILKADDGEWWQIKRVEVNAHGSTGGVLLSVGSNGSETPAVGTELFR